VIRLLLVDDHPSSRKPLAMILDREGDLCVVAQAGSLAEAREAIEHLDGDVVNRGTSGGFVVKYDAQGNTNLASTSGNVWAKQFIDGTVRTVAVDPDNNVYISLNINSDVYVYKFAPDGSLIASQPFGAYGCFGTGLLDFAFGSAVGTRSDDPSVYITGTTAGQKLDDPNNCNISTSEDSMFLIKFDGAMNKRWDRQFGGTGGDSTPIDLAVDSENNAYVTGFTPSGGQVRDPSALTGGLQNTLGGRDAFIFKYGSDGTPVYAKQFGTGGDDLARGIVAGPGQVLELTGRTTGSFDPAKPNAGLGDVFMTRRHASDGSDVVTRQFGSAGEDSALSLGYDGTTDNLVMAGITDGSLFGQNAGGQDAFVAKVGYAPDADPSDNFGSNSTGDAGSNPSDVGDPVNVTTGNVYDVREDLNISGKGLPLQFVRTYNSQDTIRKPLGYGWTHSYNTTLVENADGSVTELAPDGKRLVFTKNADGSFTAPKGVQDILTKAQDGTYKLAKKNGMEWHFANGGKLQKISDPNGNALLFSYDASSGRLSRITDSSGRDSLLEYDTSGRLTKVTDPAGRTVSYGYDPAGNLATVTDQASKVTSYDHQGRHQDLRTRPLRASDLLDRRHDKDRLPLRRRRGHPTKDGHHGHHLLHQGLGWAAHKPQGWR
jgi:YD repeat-containing protein